MDAPSANPNNSQRHHLELLVSKDAIAHRIAEVCAQIDRLYGQEELIIVMVMKGALCLVADMIRCLQVPTQIEFIQAKSYGELGTQRGELKIFGMDILQVEGKNVLIVDDIFDSGSTMKAIVQKMGELRPKSLRSLVLLARKNGYKAEFKPDFILFAAEAHFVVGYGMDYKEFYRGLPGVYSFRDC